MMLREDREHRYVVYGRDFYVIQSCQWNTMNVERLNVCYPQLWYLEICMEETRQCDTTMHRICFLKAYAYVISNLW